MLIHDNVGACTTLDREGDFGEMAESSPLQSRLKLIHKAIWIIYETNNS